MNRKNIVKPTRGWLRKQNTRVKREGMGAAFWGRTGSERRREEARRRLVDEVGDSGEEVSDEEEVVVMQGLGAQVQDSDVW